MILVDTSVWIEHFRGGVPALADTLAQGLVLLHPDAISERATGNLKDRAQTLLRPAPRAPHINKSLGQRPRESRKTKSQR